MKIHFLSFASAKFYDTLMQLQKEAEISDYFDTIECLRTHDLPLKYRLSKFLLLNRFKRGYGYWIWKSFITKEALDKIEFGDILVYADAGCVINPEARQRFYEYIELLNTSVISNLSFQTIHPERQYVKGDVLKYFNIQDNEEIKNSGQLIATIYLIRKDENSINLINKWYDICHNKTHLITDKKSQYPNDITFIDHRHDQSVFSILRKKNSSIILPDETYCTNWEENKHIPIHAQRRRVINKK